VPTTYANRLVVEGAVAPLAAFRKDDAIWQIEPWASLFEIEMTVVGHGQLVCRYDEDYKRPSPPVVDMSRAHPDLVFILEYADEFGQVGKRLRFERGEQISEDNVDALTFDWIEWEEDAE
jgi:hypothetical protein